MNEKLTLSSPKPSYHQSFVGWNLTPSAAALWQLSAQKTCQPLGIRTSWVEISPSWNPSHASEIEKSHVLVDIVIDSPPSAFVIGIDPTNVAQVAAVAFHLRQLCNRWSSDEATYADGTVRTTFLIGWFPDADREAIRILRELGLDLILHNPSRLRADLARVASFGHRMPCQSMKH